MGHHVGEPEQDDTEEIEQVHLPEVPKGWTLIQTKTLNALVCIVVGGLTILSQIFVKVFEHEEPSVALLVAGGALLGVVLPGIFSGGHHNGSR